MKTIPIKILIGIIILVIGLASFSYVLAKPIVISITPAKVYLTLGKGVTGQSYITVANPNDFIIDVKLGKEDFVPAVLPGDIRFVPKSEGATSLVSWIEMDTKTFVLEAKARKKVPFNIVVPENASPGGHYAVLFFTAIPKEAGTGNLSVTGRVGALVYLVVPGEVIETGGIVGFKGPSFVAKGPIKFTTLFENTGTSHYDPKGSIKISSLFKKEVATLTFPERTVLPQAKRSIDTVWEIEYLIGRYKAELSLTDGAGNIHTATLVFWAFPWKEVALLIGAIAVLMLLFKFVASKIKIQIVHKEPRNK